MSDLQIADDFLRLMIGKVGRSQAILACAFVFVSIPVKDIESLARMIGG